MEHVRVDGVELEYESVGRGEPVLLISPVLADGFLPLVAEPALAERYRLIRYHKRGWAGSSRPAGPVSVADHAADAAALLDALGVGRAHVAGHSSGAAVAVELALRSPRSVQSLVLLELSLLTVPAGPAFFAEAGPAFEAFGRGEHERAIGLFLGVVSGLDPDTCREVLEALLPGAFAAAVKDAETFFGVELPALAAWDLGADGAAAVGQPVLSVVGSRTRPLWVEVAAFLRGALPRVEECEVEGVGHLLHVERPEPVARAMAGFLARHPLGACA